MIFACAGWKEASNRDQFGDNRFVGIGFGLVPTNT